LKIEVSVGGGCGEVDSSEGVCNLSGGRYIIYSKALVLIEGVGMAVQKETNGTIARNSRLGSPLAVASPHVNFERDSRRTKEDKVASSLVVISPVIPSDVMRISSRMAGGHISSRIKHRFALSGLSVEEEHILANTESHTSGGPLASLLVLLAVIITSARC